MLKLETMREGHSRPVRLGLLVCFLLGGSWARALPDSPELPEMQEPTLLQRKLEAMQEKVGMAVDGLLVPPWRREASLSQFAGGGVAGLSASPTLSSIFEDLKQGRIKEAEGDEATEPTSGSSAIKLGSVDAGLQGGRFTQFAMSRFGLDLSGSLGDVGLKFLFRKDANTASSTPTS